MEEWWMTMPESMKQGELIRGLSYSGPVALIIIAAISAVSILLVLAWFLALQRYIWPRRKSLL